jgi:FkbM family methyltransferase
VERHSQYSFDFFAIDRRKRGGKPVSTAPIFDQPHYESLNLARVEAAREVLLDLKVQLHLETAIDVGCGLGHFSEFLRSIGFRVTAVDGRNQNVDEGSRRHPDIVFHTLDAESPALLDLGKFDLVFCFGLLYHLENPFRVLRNLHALTSKLLLVESMIRPGSKPQMDLVDEGTTEDQALLHIAFYPTEACLVKLMYGAGFPNVYRGARMPGHPHFQDSPSAPRLRTMLAASHTSLQTSLLGSIEEPKNPFKYGGDDERRNDHSGLHTLAGKIRRFLSKSNTQKLESVRFRVRSLLPKRPTPILLPFGAKWLLENSALDSELRGGSFERAEARFLEQFLRPGMTVLDIGAHHGFYTLLASLRVGPEGRVIAFEPSPRERTRLGRHLRFNKCKNVQVEPMALGNVSGKSDFFVVEGYSDYCNSLRPPAIEEQTRTIRVDVTSLDEYLSRSRIVEVDFIKLDVEGAELDVLRGARSLLEGGQRRPVLLVEVFDIRTKPWGYPARDVVDFLHRSGYEWFRPREDGGLDPISIDSDGFDSNLAALPHERTKEILSSLPLDAKSAMA